MNAAALVFTMPHTRIANVAAAVGGARDWWAYKRQFKPAIKAKAGWCYSMWSRWAVWSVREIQQLQVGNEVQIRSTLRYLGSQEAIQQHTWLLCVESHDSHGNG